MRTRLYEADHEAFRESFRGFIAREILPHYAEWEQAGMVSREVWRSAGAQGFLYSDLPESYGGAGVDDFRFRCIMIEEAARAGVSAAAFSLHSDSIVPYINRYGTEEQKRRWLPAAVSGECITAIAMSEPAAGSDLQGIATTALRQGDHYLLNGQKTFISNGILSDLVIVVAKTDPAAGHKGISLLVVERGMEGKWWLTELDYRVAHRRLQLHGGYGYMREYPIPRHFVDTRVAMIYGGSNEIMKEIIGRQLVRGD